MKRQPNSLASVLSWLAAVMIAVLPFHAFLSVWLSSIVGHYTLLRLWKEVVLAALLFGGVLLLITWQLRQAQAGKPGIYGRLRRSPLLLLITVYGFLVAGLGLIALASGNVTAKAYAFGLLLDTRFLLFFMIVWLVSQFDDRIAHYWRQLLLIPAAIVIAFGLLQFTLLPPDFLSHFGYGPSTIDAVQTVDQKAGYQRVQSTLRGANPLGAYLVLILSAASVGLVWIWTRRKQVDSLPYVLIAAAGCAVLALTFSRSAWIGAVAALGFIIWQCFGRARNRQLLLISGSVAVLAFSATGYALRNNDVVQNTLFHTDEHSLSSASSNQGHFRATAEGIKDIIRQPLGSGTGTAGPASAYNGPRQARIAENYFVQIGQEVGVIGLGLFVAINILMTHGLWQRRSQPLALVLLASLIGISLINLLSHAWTDDTLSYVWWGLAGAALAVPEKT